MRSTTLCAKKRAQLCRAGRTDFSRWQGVVLWRGGAYVSAAMLLSRDPGRLDAHAVTPGHVETERERERD